MRPGAPRWSPGPTKCLLSGTHHGFPCHGAKGQQPRAPDASPQSAFPPRRGAPGRSRFADNHKVGTRPPPTPPLPGTPARIPEVQAADAGLLEDRANSPGITPPGGPGADRRFLGLDQDRLTCDGGCGSGVPRHRGWNLKAKQPESRTRDGLDTRDLRWPWKDLARARRTVPSATTALCLRSPVPPTSSAPGRWPRLWGGVQHRSQHKHPNWAASLVLGEQGRGWPWRGSTGSGRGHSFGGHLLRPY